MEAHERVFEVPRRIPLSGLLQKAQPYVSVHSGASWVVDVDGRTTAVWSHQHGLRLLVQDVETEPEPHQVYFHYFGSIDANWLYQRLREGARPHRRELEEEYRPLAEAAFEHAQRRRERESPERLLTVPCVKAIAGLGAEIDLHNDSLLRFDLCGQRWTVELVDTMTIIRTYPDESLGAWIRPATFAECWLLVAAAGETRAAQGLPRLPAYTQNPAPELRPMDSWPPGIPRWTTTGYEFVAQLTGERAVEYFRLAIGRDIPQITSVLRSSFR